MQCQAFFVPTACPSSSPAARNNIGPRQHPEKAVPLFVTNALEDQPLPVYGEGLQVRDRLYVDDNCEALDLVLHQGAPGEAYNVGADNERPNIEVAETDPRLLDKPRSPHPLRRGPHRPRRRYAIDTSKLRALGWQPRHDFEAAMQKTVAWYRDNRWWWQKVKAVNTPPTTKSSTASASRTPAALRGPPHPTFSIFDGEGAQPQAMNLPGWSHRSIECRNRSRASICHSGRI